MGRNRPILSLRLIRRVSDSPPLYDMPDAFLVLWRLVVKIELLDVDRGSMADGGALSMMGECRGPWLGRNGTVGEWGVWECPWGALIGASVFFGLVISWMGGRSMGMLAVFRDSRRIALPKVDRAGGAKVDWNKSDPNAVVFMIGCRAGRTVFRLVEALIPPMLELPDMPLPWELEGGRLSRPVCSSCGGTD